MDTLEVRPTRRRGAADKWVRPPSRRGRTRGPSELLPAVLALLAACGGSAPEAYYAERGDDASVAEIRRLGRPDDA